MWLRCDEVKKENEKFIEEKGISRKNENKECLTSRDQILGCVTMLFVENVFNAMI